MLSWPDHDTALGRLRSVAFHHAFGFTWPSALTTIYAVGAAASCSALKWWHHLSVVLFTHDSWLWSCRRRASSFGLVT